MHYFSSKVSQKRVISYFKFKQNYLPLSSYLYVRHVEAHASLRLRLKHYLMSKVKQINQNSNIKMFFNTLSRVGPGPD